MSMLTPASALLKPAENNVSRENTEFKIKTMATSHGVQLLFKKRLYAVIKLRIARKPTCGG